MDFNEALAQTFKDLREAPDALTVRKILGGGSDEGEIALSEGEAWVKAQWDQLGPGAGPQIQEAIQTTTVFTPTEKEALVRFLHELADRNMPVRPRAGGSNAFERARAAAGIVEDRRSQ